MKRSAKPQIIDEFGGQPQPLPMPAAAAGASVMPKDDSPADDITATMGEPDAVTGAGGTGGKRRAPKP